MRLFVTGGAGFIGSNYVRYVLENSDDSVTVFDALTYAGNLDNLRDLDGDPRYSFVKGDITDRDAVTAAIDGHDAVVHFAAESHVDRSIASPDEFVHTNCDGTNVMCDVARRVGVERFLHISTDEVYGSIEEGSFAETDRLEPRSPYSASKAGSDLIALSYHTTYGLPVLVTRSSNNFGPYQFPEKVIPLFVTNLLEGKKVPLYGDGLNVRDWCYVADNCAAVDLVLRNGTVGEIYNIGAGNEITNRELTDAILELLGHGDEMIELRRGPTRPRPPLLDQHRQGGGARLEAGSASFARRSRPPSPGTATTRGGGSRSRPPAAEAGDRVRILITGAGGQVGHELVTAFADHDVVARRPRHARRRRPRRRARGDHHVRARRDRPRRRVHGRRRVRVRGRPCVHRERVGDPPRRRGARGASAPTSCTSPPTTCSTAPRPGPTTSGTSPTRSRSTDGASSRASSRPRPPPTPPSCASPGCSACTAATSSRRSCASRPTTPTLRFVDDQRGRPTEAADVARFVRRLVSERRPGLFHATNQGEVSWYEFARNVLDAAGLDPDRVEPIATTDLDPPRPAPRPANSVLDDVALRLSGLTPLPHFRESLDRVVAVLTA